MALERHALSAHRARLARQFRFTSRRDRRHSSFRLWQRHRLVDAALALVLPRHRRTVRLRRRHRMGRQPFQDEGGVVTVVMPAKARIQHSEAAEFDVEAALTKPSLPGVAVRRTASLPLAYARQSISLLKRRFLKMDGCAGQARA